MTEKNLNRRKFIAASAGVAALSREEKILLAQQQHQPFSQQKAPGLSLPTGKIGNVELSRLICGGNLIGGYAHSRDLIYVSSLLKNYFTKEKIFETLQLCEENGINTLITHLTSNPNDTRITDLLAQYREERDGQIQWIAQCAPFSDKIDDLVKLAIDNGCSGAFLMGALGDRWVKNRQVDLIHKTIELIKKNKIIAGVGGHSLHVPMECEKQNVDPDFYVKTFHHDRYWSATPKENRLEYNVDIKKFEDHGKDHDNMWCIDPEKTQAFMATVDKPWIAYKVMAAGAIHPREAFQFAFEGGADFILAGMFDFQVTENAIITRNLLSGNLNRSRSWMA